MSENKIRKIFGSINNWTNWVNLSRLYNSFLSKATSTFSAALIGFFTYKSQIEDLAGRFSHFGCLLLGACLYLSGYFLFSVWIPLELQPSTDLITIADNMAKIEDFQFFKTRYEMTRNLIDRVQKGFFANEILGYIAYAQRVVDEAQKRSKTDFNQVSRALYHADVNLRNYDRFLKRHICLIFLFLGLVFLLLPSIIGVTTSVKDSLHLSDQIPNKTQSLSYPKSDFDNSSKSETKPSPLSSTFHAGGPQKSPAVYQHGSETKQAKINVPTPTLKLPIAVSRNRSPLHSPIKQVVHYPVRHFVRFARKHSASKCSAICKLSDVPIQCPSTRSN